MRESIGHDTGVAAFRVLGAPVVKELCRRRPVDLATLKSVDGMSDIKVAVFGAEIIKVRVEWGRAQLVGLDHRSRISVETKHRSFPACNESGALLGSKPYSQQYLIMGRF